MLLKWNLYEPYAFLWMRQLKETHFGTVSCGGGHLNVFHRLKEELGNDLIGIGCSAHILHNAPHDALLNVIPHDIFSVLSLIYKQFYISTKQTECLKSYCDAMDLEFNRIKGTLDFWQKSDNRFHFKNLLCSLRIFPIIAIETNSSCSQKILRRSAQVLSSPR